MGLQIVHRVQPTMSRFNLDQNNPTQYRVVITNLHQGSGGGTQVRFRPVNSRPETGVKNTVDCFRREPADKYTANTQACYTPAGLNYA
jgi:hypothetical protein